MHGEQRQSGQPVHRAAQLRGWMPTPVPQHAVLRVTLQTWTPMMALPHQNRGAVPDPPPPYRAQPDPLLCAGPEQGDLREMLRAAR